MRRAMYLGSAVVRAAVRRPRRVRLLLSLAVTVGLCVFLWRATGEPRVALSGTLLALSVIRLYSLARSVAWLWSRGVSYREEVNKLPRDWEPSNRELFELYRRPIIGGDFFPFGIRAIVLQIAYESAQSRASRLAFRLAYRFWKYYWFVPLISLAGYAIVLVDSPAPEAAWWFLYATNVALCLGALAIAGEAALSYFTFGSWSLAYHRFDVAEQRGSAELSALAGGLITALVANASAIFVAAACLDSFRALTGLSPLGQLGLSYYYTLTGFTGNGDAGPSEWPGYVVMTVLYVEAAAYLLVVISLLLDSLGSEPGIKLPWVRSGQRRMRGRRPSEDG